jgi:transposase
VPTRELICDNSRGSVLEPERWIANSHGREVGMYYCGLDVSRKTTHVHLEDGQGKRVEHRVVPTTPQGLEGALDKYFARGLRVAVEAGGSTGWIHDLLRELGAQVHVVHPTKVKWIAASKKKTDRVDARLLAHLLRINGLPEAVHMPTRQSREVRRLLRARRQLVQIRTRLINVVRSVLEQQQVNLRAGPLGSRKGWRALYDLPLLPGIREIVSAYDATVVATTAAITTLETQLAVRAQADKRVAQLQTIPGVGPLTAQTVVAAIDRVHRFANARKLVGYIGLAPSVRSSGERVEYGRITKQGRSDVRAVLVQAAHALLAIKRDTARPLQHWCARVARRRGKKTAIVALARKLLTIAFYLLRDGTTFDPTRVRIAAAA